MDRTNLPQSGSAPFAELGRLKISFRWQLSGCDPCRGVAKLVKASDFDSDMRGFESFLPCQTSLFHLSLPAADPAT